MPVKSTMFAAIAIACLVLFSPADAADPTPSADAQGKVARPATDSKQMPAQTKTVDAVADQSNKTQAATPADGKLTPIPTKSVDVGTENQPSAAQAKPAKPEMPKSVQSAQAGPEDMMKSQMPAKPMRVRTGRSHGGHHKDARHCLNAGDNLAIIKCAEKYRYR